MSQYYANKEKMVKSGRKAEESELLIRRALEIAKKVWKPN